MKRLLALLLFFSSFTLVSSQSKISFDKLKVQPEKTLLDELKINPAPLSLTAKFSMFAAPVITYAGCYNFLKHGYHASIGISNSTSLFATTAACFMGYAAYKYSDYATLERIKKLLSSLNSDHLKTINLIAEDTTPFTRAKMDLLSLPLLGKNLTVTSTDTITQSISVLENYKNIIHQAKILAKDRKFLAPIEFDIFEQNSIPIDLSYYLEAIENSIEKTLKKSNAILESELKETQEEKFDSEYDTTESVNSQPSVNNTPETLKEDSSDDGGYQSQNFAPLTKENLARHNEINGDTPTLKSSETDESFDETENQSDYYSLPDLDEDILAEQ